MRIAIQDAEGNLKELRVSMLGSQGLAIKNLEYVFLPTFGEKSPYPLFFAKKTEKNNFTMFPCKNSQCFVFGIKNSFHLKMRGDLSQEFHSGNSNVDFIQEIPVNSDYKSNLNLCLTNNFINRNLYYIGKTLSLKSY